MKYHPHVANLELVRQALSSTVISDNLAVLENLIEVED